jgi:hypothetical protein
MFLYPCIFALLLLPIHWWTVKTGLNQNNPSGLKAFEPLDDLFWTEKTGINIYNLEWAMFIIMYV